MSARKKKSPRPLSTNKTVISDNRTQKSGAKSYEQFISSSISSSSYINYLSSNISMNELPSSDSDQMYHNLQAEQAQRQKQN